MREKSEESTDADKRIRVVYEMQGLTHSIKRYMDSLAETQGLPRLKDGRGISGTNLFIMAYLYEHRDRDIFQKDLEEQLNVRRSTISKVLNIMEEKELIRREQVARDGRLKKIVLTEQSMERVGLWRERSRQIESRLTRGFTEEELEQLCFLLNKAKHNFRD